MSKIRQNFHANSEALINKQINMELYASYVYMSMSAFFERDDQALHGFAKFFRKSSDEERDHAFKLIKYQHKRGGRVVFQDVAKPNKCEWNSAIEAVEAALDLEKTVNQVSVNAPCVEASRTTTNSFAQEPVCAFKSPPPTKSCQTTVHKRSTP